MRYKHERRYRLARSSPSTNLCENSEWFVVWAVRSQKLCHYNCTTPRPVFSEMTESRTRDWIATMWLQSDQTTCPPVHAPYLSPSSLPAQLLLDHSSENGVETLEEVSTLLYAIESRKLQYCAWKIFANFCPLKLAIIFKCQTLGV